MCPSAHTTGTAPVCTRSQPRPRVTSRSAARAQRVSAQEVGARLPAWPRGLSLQIPPGPTGTTAKGLPCQVSAGHSRRQKQFARKTQCPGKAQRGQSGDPAGRAEDLTPCPGRWGCRAVAPGSPHPRLPTPSAQGLIILSKVSWEDLRGARAQCRGADPLTGTLHLKSLPAPGLLEACAFSATSPGSSDGLGGAGPQQRARVWLGTPSRSPGGRRPGHGLGPLPPRLPGVVWELY